MPRKGHSESFEPADNKCLIRASDGKKKISTVVSSAYCVFMFDLIVLWSFAVHAELSFLVISGQHQRSNQVSNGRLRWYFSVVWKLLSWFTVCRFS